MFGNLFTPRYATSSLFPDGMDMHTHILWGVDDGAACLEESLGMIPVSYTHLRAHET